MTSLPTTSFIDLSRQAARRLRGAYNNVACPLSYRRAMPDQKEAFDYAAWWLKHEAARLGEFTCLPEFNEKTKGTMPPAEQAQVLTETKTLLAEADAYKKGIKLTRIDDLRWKLLTAAIIFCRENDKLTCMVYDLPLPRNDLHKDAWMPL